MFQNGHHQPSKIGIVAIAASAGGVMAIRKILSRLPADFPAPILCLQYLSRSHISVLVQILQLQTALQVRWAHDGEQLKAGVVYVCPPGHYFVVHSNRTISVAPQPNKLGWQQGVNHFFESVATSYADRAVVIVLTGMGEGGAEGVRAVSQRHGTVVVQDQAEAVAHGMPSAAIATGCVDWVLPREAIASFLINLVYEGHSASPAQAIANTAGYRAVQSTPLISRNDNLVGVLSTHFPQPRHFTAWELDLMNMHARHAADLIELLSKPR